MAVMLILRWKNLKSKSYSEMKKLKTHEERYEYLKLSGKVASETFGYDRYLNQTLYNSPEWKSVRNKVILRDNGCDLGVEGFEIGGKVLVHHLNPISKEDILNRDPKIFDLENLVCTCKRTHDAIHYGSEDSYHEPAERKPNDTCPWKK